MHSGHVTICKSMTLVALAEQAESLRMALSLVNNDSCAGSKVVIPVVFIDSCVVCVVLEAAGCAVGGPPEQSTPCLCCLEIYADAYCIVTARFHLKTSLSPYSQNLQPG